eukprot:CAMPEP_0118926984 /NCGR_PEP_ID=MMETSP1169-20130426/4570_1 /TAXON_ID=36882 /ORGANISM="Pyramimonas obovata, Strain CCMP722" /LENGTH=292 /DNA_ID=CAMNT_0006868657 /DNA_START=147 /DNA_END=1025 /DNA_ORIENTATION=-
MDMSETSCQSKSDPRMTADAKELLQVLQKQSLANLKSLFGVSDAIARLNHERYTNFDELEAKQAVLAFDGPAYKALGASELTDEDLVFAQEHMRILCGLYGVLRPLDLVRPYRLEMSNKLANPRGKDLYTFWGDSITEALNQDLEKSDGKEHFVVNCASQEYFKSVHQDKIKGTIYHMMFPGPSVYAKQARGAMCRFIIRKRVAAPEQLKEFVGNEGEWKFNAVQSTDTEFVFVRGATKAAAAKKPAANKKPAAGAKRASASAANAKKETEESAPPQNDRSTRAKRARKTPT